MADTISGNVSVNLPLAHSLALPTLRDVLIEADLLQYLPLVQTKLKVKQLEHLKFVTERDLVDIGMSRPEQRRLLKFYHKYYPQSYFGKIRSAMSRSHGNKSTQSKLMSQSFRSSSETSSEQHIISASQITMCKLLGQGEFGKVYQGVWNCPFTCEQTQVAIKWISAEKISLTEFLQEVAIMHNLRHQHIVKLYGVVIETRSVMLVSELAPWRSLLECLREISLRPSFPVHLLCSFSEQICAGMVYLEASRLIHRDLAARNILVFSSEQVKISDFGLSRSLGAGEEYYRSTFSVNLKLPIAWCAPECINFLKFTTASDIWSFGIVLWEMFTYGFQPWAGLTGKQILDAIDKPKSQRLEVPDACPQEYYSLMLQCWDHEPSKRLSFADIAHILLEIKPERLQAIVGWNDGQMDHLQYKSGELITVLDKKPREYPDGYYWKGILASGRTGLFLPSNTIAYLGHDVPQVYVSDHVQQATVSRTSSAASMFGSLRASFARDRKSLKNERVMMEGGVPCFSGVPRQIVAPFKIDSNAPSSGQPSPNVSEFSYGVNLLRREQPMGLEIACAGKDTSAHRLPSTTSETANLLSINSTTTSWEEFDNPLCLDLGPSFLDEVFEELGKRETDHEFVNESFTDQDIDSVHLADVTDRTNLLGAIDRLSPTTNVDGRGVTRGSQKKQQAFVKPISHNDARFLDQVAAVANKLSSQALTSDSRWHEQQRHALVRESSGERTPSDDDPKPDRSSSSPSFAKRFTRSLKLRNKPEPERQTFCDKLHSTGGLSDSAQEAYSELIDRPKPSEFTSDDASTDLDAVPTPDALDFTEGEEAVNPLKMLRKDGGALSFRPGLPRRMHLPATTRTSLPSVELVLDRERSLSLGQAAQVKGSVAVTDSLPASPLAQTSGRVAPPVPPKPTKKICKAFSMPFPF